MSPPRFSVVIPTHERRELVTRNVAALARQDTGDFEVIVVVDGSGDGTASALRALEAPFPLTVIEQPNRGAAAARNAGAAVAAGELILFLDDDMEADPSLLAEHARSHAEGADLVLGHIPLHPKTPPSVLALTVGRWASARGERLAADPESISERDLLTGQLSIHRAPFRDLGGFDATITDGGRFGGEDVDFGCRALDAGLAIVFNPAAISHQALVVDPGTFIRRAFDSGRAQQELTRRHPQRSDRIAPGMRLRTRRDRVLFGLWLAAPGAIRRAVIGATAWLACRRQCDQRVTLAMLAIRRFEFRRGVLTGQWRPRRSARAVVLAYHAMSDLSGDPVLAPYGVPVQRVVRQLDALQRRGWSFGDVDRVMRVLAGGGNMPRRSLLVTFDDGYTDLLTVLPALRARGIPAVAFIVSGLIGQTNIWDQPLGARRLDLLDGDQLSSLADAGVEIGSHGISHRRLAKLSAAELRTEVTESARELARWDLGRPRTISYPYGSWSPAVAAAARVAGYELAFTTCPGVVRAGSDPTALPRVEVLASDGPCTVAIRVATASWPPRLRRRIVQLLDSGRQR